MTMNIKKMSQRRSQRRVRQAIDNTKRLKALSNVERARQRVLQEEIKAKEELEVLKAKTRKLKKKRGSTDLGKTVDGLSKVLKKIDKKIFG